MRPPHSRDLLLADDGNYEIAVNSTGHGEHEYSSQDGDRNLHNAPMPTTDSEDFSGSTQSLS